MRRHETKHGDTVMLSRSQAKRLAAPLGRIVARFPNRIVAAEEIGVPPYVLSNILKQAVATRIPRPWLDVVGKAVGVDTAGWE